MLALVAVVRPALGHGDQASARSAPAPAAPTTAASPWSVPAAGSPSSVPAAPRAVGGGTRASRVAGARPVAIPDSASGRLVVVPGRAGPSGPGRKLTYRVEVEAGLPLDGAAIAEQAHRVLTDRRGWQPIEGVAFAGTDGVAAIRLLIASPDLVDRLCYPLDTGGWLSCRNGNRMILNARRWATGVPAYAGHLDDYRAYLVNHEVGHALGNGHVSCPGAGAPAPVMMQQTKGIGSCRRNPWPAIAP